MKSIIDENDLTYYENKLYGMSCPIKKEEVFNNTIQNKNFAQQLLLQKGKLLKVEIIGERFNKTGILMDVGEDFLCIKVGCNPVSVLIPFCRIATVTVVHNNNSHGVTRYLNK